MSPEEKNVIAGIFDRLAQAEGQQRDAEAERFIAERIRAQPYAPYVMAQAIYVQEQALTNLSQEVEQLRTQVEELSQRPQAAPQASGGFLSGLFGGGAPQPQAQPYRPGAGPAPSGLAQSRPDQAAAGPWGRPQPAAAAGPWGQQAAPGQQRGGLGGGGFLAGAMSTALGVAGGMMIANALSSAFSGGDEASKLAEGAGEAGKSTTAADAGGDATADKGWQDASADTGDDDMSFDDGGFDDGDFA